MFLREEIMTQTRWTIRLILAGLALLGLLVMMGCGMCSRKPDADQAAQKAEEAREAQEAAEPGLQQMGDALSKMKEAMEGKGEPVEPVNYQSLKALLPETAADLARESAEGEKTGAMGVKVSMARARYANEESSLEIEITDMGTASGLTAMASAAWTLVDMDKESDAGYERTTTYRGHRAFEEYDNNAQRGEMRVLVAKRFIVNVQGSNLPMDRIKSALNEVDFSQLAALAKEASETAQ